MIKGFTCGAFDLLHAGHILMLEECSKHCDYLIVGLQIDPSFDRKDKNKPIQSIVERQIQLKAVKWVDEIVMYQSESELELLCNILDFNVRFVGKEYRGKWFTGKGASESKGEIIFNKRDHQFSSSELRKRISTVENKGLWNDWNIKLDSNPPSTYSTDTLSILGNVAPLSTSQLSTISLGNTVYNTPRI